GLVRPGEVGIDPELGRFAFAKDDPSVAFEAASPPTSPPGDPTLPPEGLSVDYVEAFGDRVGARSYDRDLDPKIRPNRLVARSGDAGSRGDPSVPALPVHASLRDAYAQAVNRDVIEIVDSGTYVEHAEIVLDNPEVRQLTVRAAAGQRPCLTFYSAGA